MTRKRKPARSWVTVSGPSPVPVLDSRFRVALNSAFGPECEDTDPDVRPSRHADLQTSAAMRLARPLGLAPEDVARRIVAGLDVADIADVQVSGGFINLMVRDEWIFEQVRAAITQAMATGGAACADLAVPRCGETSFDHYRMALLTGYVPGAVRYAGRRMESVFVKGGLRPEPATAPVVIGADRALAQRVLKFGVMVELAGAAAEPHRLVEYLYGLARLSMAFYEGCPVQKYEVDEDTRRSLLALCGITLRVLAAGLKLLGSPQPDRM
ncbi:DALR anticodon-binding domain-containing protein [Actinomadura sp. WMMA1423]|uniref:DALR anticodon-binding domain-containing protein n=1 Tax=Actinomadura sp. WMMA1423 TaxID=2591108 RepID=UPI0011479F5E|nr:DALR anticodon-binding domain-containing protein [Actinomadura sp. WMMA1423]